MRKNNIIESSDNACPCCDNTECQCGPECMVCGGCGKYTNESLFTFDKFMDKIVLEENKKRPTGDSPMRERAKRHQERPMGRIRFGGGR